ncbi:MAG: glycosyltransferase family 4 protein [Myxococcota bacterium]|nr:glycosyltransferase family 4 protein [Myxococcota bacterium]
MKLALVHRTFSDCGGTERFVRGLSRYLVARGHSVHVWCNRSEQVPDGVEIRHLPAWGRGRILKALVLWWQSRRLPRGEYDVVLGFGRTVGHDLYRAGGGCHRAWMMHRTWSLADWVEERLDRSAVAAARTVVANSRLAEGQLRDLYGVPADSLRVVHNGVDLDRFCPLEAPSGSDGLPGEYVAFVGSGFARKGLESAIRVLARLSGPDLVVAGIDRRWRHYQKLAGGLGIGEKVHFLGRVDQVETVLAGARALLLPTRYDPFANVCLEAMACGVPPVTTARNGASEVLPYPWMVVEDPDDVEGLASALERVMQETGLADTCRSVAERFPARSAFERMEALAMELRA